MEARQSNSPETALLHMQAVEGVLGVPLFPQGLEREAAFDDTIRDFAYTSVVRALQDRYGGIFRRDDLDPAGQEVQDLHTQQQFKRLAAEVQAANDTLRNWHNPPAMPAEADSPDTPRGRFQARAMAALVEHAQRAPGNGATSDNPYQGGLLTMAPPGAGKSVLQALAVNYAGVGLPVSESDPRRRTGVGIMNSKLLIRQCLDPSETLQRFANVGGRDIRIGGYFNERHDGHDEYDFVLTTPRSYATAVRSGAINTETTVRYMLDEAHRVALAPGMRERVSEFSSGLYMFTATPAIAGGRRDLRRQFPHSQFGSMREFVEDGILSPVQLFTYRAGPETGSAARLAVSLAADYVRSGRKTLVVCQPGSQLEQARQIAEELNQLYRHGDIIPHDKFGWEGQTLACAIGTFPGANTKQDIQLFRDGQRLIATTVATGNEGLNIPDLDALVIIGPQGATWVVEQWLGRILRPSGQMAVASEILPHNLQPGKPIASIFGPFGLHDEVITEGYYIGPPLLPGEHTEPAPGSPHLSPPTGILPGQSSDIPMKARGMSPDEDTSGHYQGYTPPEEAHASLVTGVSVREATIAPSDLLKLPPAGYAPLTGLARDEIPLEWLYAMLDKLDDPEIRYVGVWGPDEAGEMQYLRYYSPAARNYFVEHPIPELASDSELLDGDIASLLGVSRSYVRRLLDRHGIKPLDRITKHHRNPNYYGIDTLELVAAEVARTPLAAETDVALVDLGREISSDFVRNRIARPDSGITAIDKRRHPVWGVAGSAQHITGEEADRLRAAYKSLEVADAATRIGFNEIARLSGMAVTSVWNKWNALPEDVRPQTYWLRSGPKVRATMYVDREWGEAFAEVIRPEKVLPWEATLSMVALYFGKKKLNMSHIIARRGTIEPYLFPLPGVSETVLYPLSVIADLRREGMSPDVSAPPLITSRVALTPEDAGDSKKVAASQELQRYYIPPEQIAQPDELGYYAARRQFPPKLPPVNVGPDAKVGPEPVREQELPEPQVEPKSPPEPAEVLLPAPEEAPQPDASQVYSLEAARGYVDCSEYAFEILMQRVPFRQEDTVIDGSGVITGLRGQAITELRKACRDIAAPPAGWTSLTMTARAAGHISKTLVMSMIGEIASARGYLARDDEVLLCRIGSEVELYFSASMRRSIRKAIFD